MSKDRLQVKHYYKDFVKTPKLVGNGQPGMHQVGPGTMFYVVYTLVPWVGVMAAGYALGPTLTLNQEARRLRLVRLGLILTLGFIVLRATNLYGDPAPWTMQSTWLATALSFVNCEKYPPSLLFLMMTLGPRCSCWRHSPTRAGDCPTGSPPSDVCPCSTTSPTCF
jgi:uncharacterized membrane protein